MTEKTEFEKRVDKAGELLAGRLTKADILPIIAEARKEIFPLPKGYIIQNNTTGARDKIVLELKDWLPFINKLRDWFGDKK